MQRLIILMSVIVFASWSSAADQEKAFKPSDREQELLDLTNAERRKEGLPDFTFHPLLCEVARAHAANMVRQRKLDHVLDGKNPMERIKEAGYKPALGGENISRGNQSLITVLTGWMKSKEHRRNILDPEFADIGIGMATAESGELYYVQVFAKPR